MFIRASLPFSYRICCAISILNEDNLESLLKVCYRGLAPLGLILGLVKASLTLAYIAYSAPKGIINLKHY